MFYNSPLSLFDDFFAYNCRPSVYVISDSQLAEFKQQQLQAEIAELDKLIDSHKQSIDRLENTKIKLTEDVQKISPSQSQPDSLPVSEHSESQKEI